MSGAPTDTKPLRSWSIGEWPVYLVLAMIAMILAANIEFEKTVSVERAEQMQRDRSIGEARNLAGRIERYFDQVYRGLRTIARLPSVRAIDSRAANFHAFARGSVQEIYNNLAETAKVSEVYIVPLDFDPDAIDPQTNKPQEPLAAFDELIVGQSADRRLADRTANTAAGAAVEEIEVHEYRLMRRQIAKFKAGLAASSVPASLSYPALIGEEVVTCDNTHYSARNPNDADRKGMVFSLPFYDLDGRMHGIVSAVMLSSSLRLLLPDAQYAMFNREHDFDIKHKDAMPVADLVGSNEAGRTFAYVERLPLHLHDATGGWVLEFAASKAAVDANPEVLAARDKAYHRQLAILVSFAALCSIVRLSAQRHREIQMQNAILEAKVAERTRALEVARAAAEAASLAKTDFLAHMSHEIRTPMSAVIGTVDLLLRSETETTKAQQLGIVRKSGQALIDLINQMLDLAAVETGQVALSPSVLQLRSLVADVADLFEPQCRAKGLHLETMVGDGVPETIWLDGGCCRQVLVNLVANAIKATEMGGVFVHVGIADGGNLAGPYLQFDVADTGGGMPAEAVAGLFVLKGVRRRQSEGRVEGAGLGLPISRLLVEKMGGKIEFQRRPAGGSLFRFVLPLQRADARAVSGEHAIGRNTVGGRLSSLSGVRVLLVEDNPTLAQLTRGILDGEAAEITVMSDGLSSITAWRSRPFDIILMDCRLQGMDGLAVTKLIRAEEAGRRCSPIPIIALTANAYDWDRDACLEAGMNDFVSKPFTVEQLLGAIARNLATTKPDAVRSPKQAAE